MNLSNTSQAVLEKLTNTSNHKLYNSTLKWLRQLNLSDEYLHVVNAIIWLFALLLVLFLVDWFTNRVLIKGAHKLIRVSKTNLDDFIIANRTLTYVGRYIPLSITKFLIPIVFMGFPQLTKVLITGVDILMLITLIMIIKSLLRTTRDILRTKPGFADKPLNSYLQVLEIFLLLIGGTVVFSILTGNSPWAFLASLGAASAILMLVFKDTILGFVASVQVSTNDSIRVGDWIEMTKYDADGTVIEINLNNIKIQNFDKTITTIPTHQLLSDSFKNWRGMQASGGRRIKRAINIRMSSIHFLTEEEISTLSQIQLLKEYIETRKEEIAAHNENTKADQNMPVNGRKMTNIGLFRAYVTAYINQNPNIHKEMTLMVRQLAPTEKGLPLELYMFTNDTNWVKYESIMADIFDHLFATTKFFNLEIFEYQNYSN